MTRPDPDRTKATILRIFLIVWLLACIAMGAFAYIRSTAFDGPWAAWERAARQAERAHLRNLQQQGERDYIAWQQGECGPESGVRAAPDGALWCTDKTGRRRGKQLAGANP